MGGIFVPREIIESPEPWKPERMASGHYALDTTWKQDYVAIVSQGDVVDRNAERLGWSDRGIIMLRQMYMQAIEDIQAGRDPKGVVRDPNHNPVLTLPAANTLLQTGEKVG